jgi:hypothetical protein
MQERKLDILLSCFPYSGNSTGSSLCWESAEWLMRECHRLQTDEQFTSRIRKVGVRPFTDTPITMTRNQAVSFAREQVSASGGAQAHPRVQHGERTNG